MEPNPKIEYLKCLESPLYFTTTYVQIYNATATTWLPFTLWPAQATTLDLMTNQPKLVLLKARQLGISWLALTYALWLMVFRPPATILLFSLREAEAIELLNRLKGMYNRLPPFLQSRTLDTDNNTSFVLSTGSRSLAFSTRAGRSYTGTLAIIDEADFVPDLNQFLNGIKPTIDAGGQLFLISTSDKTKPVSTFKNLFRYGLTPQTTSDYAAGLPVPHSQSDYRSLFLPWTAAPHRTADWHERTKAEMFAQRGTDDDFYAEYPATPEEALAPEQLDRRIPFSWLEPCLQHSPPLDHPLAIPGLTVYEHPAPTRRYVIGADPAEGNPNSDDSAATVLDAATWKEVASFTAKVEPAAFAHYLDQISLHYHQADILPERNNHGHSLIRALQESGWTRILAGYDGKLGWLSNIKGKPLLYDLLAEAIRQQETTIRNPITASQIASIEASTLNAPAGLHDDQADSYALAIAALAYRNPNAAPSHTVSAPDPLAKMDKSKEW